MALEDAAADDRGCRQPSVHQVAGQIAQVVAAQDAAWCGIERVYEYQHAQGFGGLPEHLEIGFVQGALLDVGRNHDAPQSEAVRALQLARGKLWRLERHRGHANEAVWVARGEGSYRVVVRLGNGQTAVGLHAG